MKAKIINPTKFDFVRDFLESSALSVQEHTESSANIKFTDMFTGGSLNADVMYDLSVLDNSNTEVVKKEGLIAKNSQDMQSLSFSGFRRIPNDIEH